MFATSKRYFSSIKMKEMYFFHSKQSINLDTNVHTRALDTKAA